MSPTNPIVSGIINFHGLTLMVLHFDGVDYIYAKPLADLAGVDWRTAKKTFQEEENAVLYGTRRLKHPHFAAEGGASTPTPHDAGVYIRLDRGRMYLARINTRQMKSQGNVEAAERLLALQIEWADALHKYETQGVAFKRRKVEDRGELLGLLKARSAASSAGEKDALTRMIHDNLADLGYPVAEPQQTLPV